MSQPIIVMNGLGYDTSYLLHRYHKDASFRIDAFGNPFELSQLISLTAQTGNEWERTSHLQETYLYPIYREQGQMRVVQIGKGGPSTRDGYVVLNDTTQPERCYVWGTKASWDQVLSSFPDAPQDNQWGWTHDLQRESSQGTLSIADYYLANGTVPQFRRSRRECSDKFKQTSLEAWMEDNAEAVVQEATGEPGWSLGENLLRNRVVPQYVSTGGRRCSDQYKIEPNLQWVGNEFGNGSWSLGEGLLANGTVPQYHPQHRKCSDHYKQRTCNQWTADFAAQSGDNSPRVIQVAIGFHAGENERISRAEFAQLERASRITKKLKGVQLVYFYPLHRAGIDRLEIEKYGDTIITGGKERFSRSACTICPFAGICGSKEEVLGRHRHSPEESAYAMLVEYVSRCLNPRQTLFPNGRSLHDLIAGDENWKAIEAFEGHLNRIAWGVYEVKRVYSKAPKRSVKLLAVGNRQSVRTPLLELAKERGASVQIEQDADSEGIYRVMLEMKEAKQHLMQQYAREHLLVCAPLVVTDKTNTAFESAMQDSRQLMLFDEKPFVQKKAKKRS